MDSSLQTASRLIEGFRTTALIATAVKLKIFDALSEIPVSATQIAHTLNLHSDALRRTLRGLALLDLVTEHAEHCFSLTQTGRLLRSDSKSPLPHYARLCETQYLPAFMATELKLRTGNTSFETAFGKPVWDYRRDNPEAGELFNQWLLGQSSPIANELVAAIDFSSFQNVVDVGGGKGILLAQILHAFPDCCGVLADQASVVQEAKEFFQHERLVDRCTFIPTDFFKSVPRDGDAYLLKSILHDWEDPECLNILNSICAAIRPDTPLFIIERMLPEQALNDPETIWMDLMMMNVTGGRERSLEEYKTLLDQAGLRLEHAVPLGDSFQALNAVKK